MKERSILAAGAGLLIAILPLGVTADEVHTEAVPKTLEAPSAQVLTISARGVGVQIYECTAGKEDSMRYSWTLKAPEAELRDKSGRKLGKHYAGPTWEANDGSKVVGDVVARDNGPDGAAIPWLLLRAKSTSGTGVFSAILSVQRLHTGGGKAPGSGCDQTQSGKEARVPYTADYYFYAARP
jgi:Protein of unknown function (DUF3455)